MKVAVVTDYFPTSTQPWAGHSAYQTLRVLAERCELQVFYPEATYPKLLTPSGKGSAIDRAWSPPDVKATYIPYTAVPVVSRGFNGFSIARALLEPVRAFAPDVILNYVIYPAGFGAVRIGKKLGVPVVLTAIGSDLNRIADPLCGVWTKAALRGASMVTTVSHDLAKTAVTLGADPEHTRAILNGCDTSVFHPRDRAEARRVLGIDAAQEIVLYVGRMDYRKGLVELIEAAAALMTKRPRTHTYLLGSGPDEATLREAIAKHGAGAAVSIIPACPTAQVAQWMGAADLVTLPSYKEGCPNVVIEAVSSGRPVVATRVGGIPELMDESCGRLVPAMDVPALTAALEEVLDAEWSAEAISARHSRSWAEVADDLLGVLTGARCRP
jgi:teichuronic acid biosynthesis glycosyltransferase TuaC